MVTDMRQRSSHVKSTLLCALRIYFGVQLCIGALGGVALYMSFVFSSEGIDAQNAIALVIMTFGCTAGGIKLLRWHKPKSEQESAAPQDISTETEQTNSDEMCDSDASQVSPQSFQAKKYDEQGGTVNCKKCGATLPQGSKFCSECGSPQIISTEGRFAAFLSRLFHANVKRPYYFIQPKTEEEIARERDRQELSRDYASNGCAYRDIEILHDSYRLCRNTSSITTFTERYSLLLKVADRLYRADTYEIPNVVKLGERDLYRYILENKEEFKTIFLKNYSKNLFDKVSDLKTKKGKVTRLLNGIDELEANHFLFENTAEYDRVIDKIQRNVDVLQ